MSFWRQLLGGGPHLPPPYPPYPKPTVENFEWRVLPIPPDMRLHHAIRDAADAITLREARQRGDEAQTMLDEDGAGMHALGGFLAEQQERDDQRRESDRDTQLYDALRYGINMRPLDYWRTEAQRQGALAADNSQGGKP